MRRRAGMSCSGLVASVVVLITVWAVMISVCLAQEYPNRPIDIVVPHNPGGAVDSFFRIIQDPLARALKVPVSIVNRPGGGGVTGSSFVANSKPDGYILLAQEYTTLLMPQIVTPKTVPYHVLKDFSPIVYCAEDVSVLVVKPNLACNTFDELISYAKKNPGKLVAGTSGFAALNRIVLEVLKSSAGVDITNLSFSGGGEAMTNLLGGHIDMIPSAPLMGVISHIKTGKMKVLVVMTAERIPDLPQVPTVKEKGFPELMVNGAFCIVGPKGLSQQITGKLAAATKEVLQSPEVSQALKGRGYLVNYLPPNQLSERMTKDFALYEGVAKKAGLIKE